MIYVYDYEKDYGGGLVFVNARSLDKAQGQANSLIHGRYGKMVYKCTMKEFIATIKKDGYADYSWEE